MGEKICISDLTLDALTAYIVGLGQPKFRAKQIFKWLHQKLVTEFSQMTDQPKALLAQLEEQCTIAAPVIRRRDRLCLNPVPENIGIVPAIVARHILIGFFAVLVLFRAVPVKSPLLRASCCAVTAPKALLPIRSLWALRGLLTSCPRRSYWTIIFTPAPCVRCRPATARSAA